MEKNRKIQIRYQRVERRCSLVQHRCVGIPVLLDDRDNEHDEFWPEVQVLDAGTLLLQGQLLLVLGGSKARVKARQRDGLYYCLSGRETHRVGRLVLPAVQLVVVVEDVVVGRVEAGFDTVPHHLAGSGRRLELLDLNATQRH